MLLSARPAPLPPALGLAVVLFAPERELLELRDFEPDPEPLDLVAIKQDLEDVIGRPVDVVTEAGLSPYLRQRVLAEAIPL